jgi:hypothetical protein
MHLRIGLTRMKNLGAEAGIRCAAITACSEMNVFIGAGSIGFWTTKTPAQQIAAVSDGPVIHGAGYDQ